jgi:hypothetical protein
MNEKPPTVRDRDYRRTERWQAFLKAAADAGGAVYAASDVHKYLDAIARGRRGRWPEADSLSLHCAPRS